MAEAMLEISDFSLLRFVEAFAATERRRSVRLFFREGGEGRDCEDELIPGCRSVRVFF